MASFFLGPDPLQGTWFIPGGNTPASGGQLFFYVDGSVSTKQTVYKDSAGAVSWTNPVVLDSGGNLPSGGEVWFASGQTYKVVFAPSNDTDPPGSPYRTLPSLSGINDTAAVSASEWVSGPTPTFVNATTFTLVGDQTGTFAVGRRLKFTVTAGTVYGRITNSVFGAVTTLTMLMDSGQALDSGLTAVSYGILSPANPSVPFKSGLSPLGIDLQTVASYTIPASDNGALVKNSFSSAATWTLPVASTVKNGWYAYLVNGAVSALTVLSGFSSDAIFTGNTTSGSTSFSLGSVSTGPSGTFGVGLVADNNNNWHVFDTLKTLGYAPLRSYLTGFTLSTTLRSSSTVMSTAPGVACDSTNAVMMNLSSTIWKTATTWAAGTGNGGLLDPLSPVLAGAWYHFYEIMRPDTGAVDVGYSSTSVAPPLPTNYIYARRIGSAKTTSTATWRSFIQDGDYFILETSVLDVNSVNPGSTAVSVTLATIPLGINVEAHIQGSIRNTGTVTTSAYFSDLAQSDESAVTAYDLSQSASTTGGVINSVSRLRIRTNTSSQIRARLSASDGNTTLFIRTLGWYDPRGKNN